MTLYAVKSTGKRPHNLVTVAVWSVDVYWAEVENKDGQSWLELKRDLARVHVERVC